MTTSFGKVKKPSAATIRCAKKYKIKVTIKRGGKRSYKKESVIKRQCKKRERAMKKKLIARRKRIAKCAKAAAKRCANTRKKTAKKTVKRLVSSRRTAFGVGGSYMPLASMMSPYPRSVDASPPWI